MAKRSLGFDASPAGNATAMEGDALAKAVLADKGTALFTSEGLGVGSQTITNQLDPFGDRAVLGSSEPVMEVYDGALRSDGDLSGSGWVSDGELPTPAGNFQLVAHNLSLKNLVPAIANTGAGIYSQDSSSGTNQRVWSIHIDDGIGEARLLISADGSTVFTDTGPAFSSLVTANQVFSLRYSFNFSTAGFSCPVEYSFDNEQSWNYWFTHELPGFTALELAQTTVLASIGSRRTTSTGSPSPADAIEGGIGGITISDRPDLSYDFRNNKNGVLADAGWRLITTGGADLNDPEVYPVKSESYFQIPLSGSNEVTVPTVSRSFTNTYEVRYYLGPDGCQPNDAANNMCLGGFADSASSGFFVYQGDSLTDCLYRFFGGFGSGVSTDEVVVPTGTKFLRVLGDIATDTATLSWSNDELSWTDAASDTGMGTTATLSPQCALGNLPYSGTNPYDGAITGVSLWLDGVEVERIDARDAEDGNTFTTKFGTTATVSRAATGYKTALIAPAAIIQADGADDYIQLPASLTPTFTKTTGNFTVLAVVRDFDLTATWNRIYSSEFAGNNGFYMAFNSLGKAVAVIGDGTAKIASNPSILQGDGQIHVIGATYADGLLRSYNDTDGLSAGVDTTTIVGTVTHNTPRLLAFSNGVSNTFNGDLFSVLTLEGSYTEDAIAAIGAYLKGLVE